MRTWLRPIAGGALGMTLILLLWHAYTDHVAFHQIVNLINANAVAQQQTPAATP